ncbi:hypothetical protein HDU98_003914 [Podochytrium sp. JEL0797]|nr:hypothetical protein HDU98_003914 [Podochytrium sp. JEL0797]
MFAESEMSLPPPSQGSATTLAPATFILIRHAEKLTWDHGAAPGSQAKLMYIDDHQLSSKGLERSHALVGYFLHRKEILDIYAANGPLAAIVCQGVNASGKGKSERPKQTIYPLYEQISLSAHALSAAKTTGGMGLQSDTYHPSKRSVTQKVELLEYTKAQFASMVHRLKSSEFAGKTVIVSWSHQTLPHLAVALGVPAGQVPGKWGKRFDLTWVVRGGELRQMAQRLLFGDEEGVGKMKGGCVGEVEREVQQLMGGSAGNDGSDDD